MIAFGILLTAALIWGLIAWNKSLHQFNAEAAEYARRYGHVPLDYGLLLMKQYRFVLNNFLELEEEEKAFLKNIYGSEKYAWAIIYIYQHDLIRNRYITETDLHYRDLHERSGYWREQSLAMLKSAYAADEDRQKALLTLMRLAFLYDDAVSMEAIGDYYADAHQDLNAAYLWYSAFMEQNERCAYKAFKIIKSKPEAADAEKDWNRILMQQFIVPHMQDYHVHVADWQQRFMHPESLLEALAPPKALEEH